MIPHKQLEWCSMCSRVNVIVVAELGKGNEFGPVFSSVIAEDPKIKLKFLIEPFGPSVCLRVISGGH